MDKIIVSKPFTLHGLLFEEGDVFYGKYIYASNLDKDKILPLVVVCNEFNGPFLLPKEYFKLN